MPLVTCPDCGAKVSSRAPACPTCGCPLGGAGPFGGTDQGMTTRPDWLHDPNVGCIAAAIAIIALVVSMRGC